MVESGEERRASNRMGDSAAVGRSSTAKDHHGGRTAAAEALRPGGSSECCSVRGANAGRPCGRSRPGFGRSVRAARGMATSRTAGDRTQSLSHMTVQPRAQARSDPEGSYHQDSPRMGRHPAQPGRSTRATSEGRAAGVDIYGGVGLIPIICLRTRGRETACQSLFCGRTSGLRRPAVTSETLCRTTSSRSEKLSRLSSPGQLPTTRAVANMITLYGLDLEEAAVLRELASRVPPSRNRMWRRRRRPGRA